MNRSSENLIGLIALSGLFVAMGAPLWFAIPYMIVSLWVVLTLSGKRDRS